MKKRFELSIEISGVGVLGTISVPTYQGVTERSRLFYKTKTLLTQSYFMDPYVMQILAENSSNISMR